MAWALGTRLGGQPPPWHRDAECRGVPVEVFFPDPATPEAFAKAAAYCDRCPVAADCADHAATHGEAWGIWAGQPMRSERSLHRSARKAERLAALAAEREAAQREAEAARLAARRRAENRRAYQRRKARRLADPAAAAVDREQHRLAEARWMAKVRATDPERAELLRKRKAEQNRVNHELRRAEMAADPDVAAVERARKAANERNRRARVLADPELADRERERRRAERARARRRARAKEAPMPEPTVTELLARADQAGLVIEGVVEGLGLLVRLPQGYTPDDAALADALVARTPEVVDHLVAQGMDALAAELPGLGGG